MKKFLIKILIGTVPIIPVGFVIYQTGFINHLRNFEVIGEAIKNISKEIQEKYTSVEWKEAAGFRDVLIHDYFGIDLEAVWDTIKINIPPFKKHMTEVLKHER